MDKKEKEKVGNKKAGDNILFLKIWGVSAIVFVIMILDAVFNDHITITVKIFTPIAVILGIAYIWFLDHNLLIKIIRELTSKTQNKQMGKDKNKSGVEE